MVTTVLVRLCLDELACDEVHGEHDPHHQRRQRGTQTSIGGDEDGGVERDPRRTFTIGRTRHTRHRERQQAGSGSDREEQQRRLQRRQDGRSGPADDERDPPGGAQRPQEQSMHRYALGRATHAGTFTSRLQFGLAKVAEAKHQAALRQAELLANLHFSAPQTLAHFT